MPRLSVVMPVYDVAPYVEEAVRSVLDQTFGDFELIVIDDGSTDGTARIVEGIADPRIRLIRTEHAGLVEAENLGLALATGEYVSRADGDDVLLPVLFERQVEILQAHPEVAAVGAWFRRFGGMPSYGRPPTEPEALRRRLRWTNALTQPVMYRAALVRDLGGYRAVTWEDWDLWIRLAARHDLRNIPEPLILLRYRPQSYYWSASRVAKRGANLQMRLLALRLYGPRPKAAAIMLRTGLAFWVYRVFERFLPPRPRPAEPRPLPAPVSVVVPTYGRAEALERCLAGVESQRPPADQVVVVYREEDEPTVRFLKSWVGADPGRREMVAVARPGEVPALLAGTAAVRGEVVVYLDDDAVPRPGWLEELRRGFTDPAVGAVGGRVVDHPGGREVTGWTRRVGELTWYGRLIGRHHLPTDRYGYVDWVTGGNRAFRLDLARHDHRLRHTARGRAMPNDVDASLAVGRLGWRVLYTPWAVVDHYPEAPRHGTLPTRVLEDEVEATAANHDYVLLKHLSGVGRVAFRAYGYVVGTSTLPGPARALAELPRSPRRSLAMARRILPAWRGRMEGARMHRAWRRQGRSAR